MVEYYKTIDGRITSVPAVCEGCWVNLIHPTSEELRQVTSALHVEEDFIRAALDPEESSRVELEEDQILMIVDTPVVDTQMLPDGSCLKLPCKNHFPSWSKPFLLKGPKLFSWSLLF